MYGTTDYLRRDSGSEGHRHRATTGTTSPKRERRGLPVVTGTTERTSCGTPERHRLFSEHEKKKRTSRDLGAAHLTNHRPGRLGSRERPHTTLLVKGRSQGLPTSERRHGAPGFYQVVAATAGVRARSFSLRRATTSRDDCVGHRRESLRGVVSAHC